MSIDDFFHTEYIKPVEERIAKLRERFGGRCLPAAERAAFVEAKASIVSHAGGISMAGANAEARRLLHECDTIAATVTFEPDEKPQNPHACAAVGCILALPGPRVGVGTCRCLEDLDEDHDRRVRVRNGIKWLRSYAITGCQMTSNKERV